MNNVVQFQSASKMSPPEKSPPICEQLVSVGKLKSEHVDHALRLQIQQLEWEQIGTILVKLGFVSERDLVEGIANQLSIRMLERSEFPDQLLYGKQISPRFLRANKAMIIDEDENNLWVVMADPQEEYVIKALALISGKIVLPLICIPSEIDAALEQLYDAPEEVGESTSSTQFAEDVEQLKELAGEAPVIKLVNQLIQKAAESGASDIHIEPFEDQVKIRYRIDGLLREVEAPPAHSAAAVISRIKILANMDIAERRLAQDGRFKQRIRGKEFDFRISTVPTIYGESVVLRLLQRDEAALDFGPLGFNSVQTEKMFNILAQPHGIVLVTGPTGSGKSTTLYAALRHLNEPERMIITVEDPVEYNIHSINQIQVKPQIGLTFSNALRSIVRQDPDVIMIGEMRDSETAQIAVQSALTGHLVLSTLHTNDAAGSVMRLIDMGIPDYLLISAVNAIQAQRLVRRLCTQCRQPYQPCEEVDRWALDRFADKASISLYHAIGCKTCGGTGYDKRTAILEILPISNRIKQLVLQHSDTGKISAAAVEEGMLTIRDDGFSKVITGLTTIEEVLRVTPDPV
jgi:general secretion pathway protein E